MNQEIEKLLLERKENIVEHWENRISHLIPQSIYVHKRKQLVGVFYSGLEALFCQSDFDLAINRIRKSVSILETEVNNPYQCIIKSILISRYVILAEVVRGETAFNSLEFFEYLNDALQPLIKTLSRQSNVDSILPKDFRARELGLLSIDFAGIGLFLIDKDYNLIFWNKGMTRLYGISEEETIGQNLFEVVSVYKKDEYILLAIHNAMTNGDETELTSVKQRTPHRGERLINLKIAPLLDIKDKLVGASVLIDDITERKEHEITLRTFERYFENIFNDAADAVIILDVEDRILKWNRGAERMYGWEEEEMITQSIDKIAPTDAEIRKEIKWINGVVKEKGFIRNYKTERLSKGGRRLIVEITRTAIRNESGDYIGSSVISRDITEQERLRQQLMQSEKLSAVGTLAAGIAHEIGAPLTAISSLSQLLKNRTTDPFFIEKISLIQQSIDRIFRTVRTLVDFSRPVTAVIERIYLNHVIEQVLNIIKYDTRLKHHKITTQLSADLPQVKASFDQLLQVLINLILNSADAMEDNKDGVLIIKSWAEQDSVFVSVTDNGNGIPSDKISHVFEPFFTTKPEGKGTGLGLWVSYNIIKNFSGKIAIESKLGEGTTMTVSLPADRANSKIDFS